MSGGVFGGFLAVLGREWKLALRHPSDTLAAVLFFVLVAALFPFGVGPAPETLSRLAPGALLAAALLAALLPLDRLFGAEAEDGSLDQLLLSGLPRGVLAAAKALGLGALAGLPGRVLSTGQRRRLALARLALAPARLWLLDEPSLGLDAASVARLGDLMARHRAAGGAILAATHLPLPLPDAQELKL